ncbi:hypothetical protein CLV38_10973 [Alkalibacterium olivapovliticus]|uniref:Uncharacterized protein n=1 Tax=Alkalibacterium olivapovliticus TaxID=99907 RepID=A0A2T0W7R9_9LACT|nr:hypothetical protein CLV38_10973 [Alkalibacterium olivapovliticus]
MKNVIVLYAKLGQTECTKLSLLKGRLTTSLVTIE